MVWLVPPLPGLDAESRPRKAGIAFLLLNGATVAADLPWLARLGAPAPWDGLNGEAPEKLVGETE